MTPKPTYKELELRIRLLEKEVLEYVRKEKELSEKRKFIDYSHMKRTISLIQINNELNKEIDDLTLVNKEKLGKVTEKLQERIKELDCLYNISTLRDSATFSLDNVLQSIVDFIPPAIKYTEIACARIVFDGHKIQTLNFIETKWSLSQAISVGNELVGTLEIGYLEEKPELEDGQFIKETKHLISAIAENIAQLIERDWVETEIIKCRNRIAKLIDNGGT